MSEVESKNLSTLILTILKELSEKETTNTPDPVIISDDKFLGDMIDITISTANNERIVEDTAKPGSQFSFPNMPKINFPTFSLGNSNCKEGSDKNATDNRSTTSSTNITGSLSSMTSGLGSVISSLIPKFYKEPKEHEDYELPNNSCKQPVSEKTNEGTTVEKKAIAYNGKGECIIENGKIGDEKVNEVAKKLQ